MVENRWNHDSKQIPNKLFTPPLSPVRKQKSVKISNPILILTASKLPFTKIFPTKMAECKKESAIKHNRLLEELKNTVKRARSDNAIHR